MNVVRQLPGEGVICHYLHIKAKRRFLRHQFSDVARANQAQGLALQLGLWDSHLGIAVVALAVGHHGLKIPGAVEHIENRQLRHRDGVGPAGSGDQHLIAAGGLQVNSVIARPMAGYDLQFGGVVQYLRGNLSGPDNHGVTVSHIRQHILLRKATSIHHFIAVVTEIGIAFG